MSEYSKYIVLQHRQNTEMFAQVESYGDTNLIIIFKRDKGILFNPEAFAFDSAIDVLTTLNKTPLLLQIISESQLDDMTEEVWDVFYAKGDKLS